jgi:PAS domain S-box-containing protein
MPNHRLFQNNIFFGIIIVLLGFFAWYSYHRVQKMIDSANLVNKSNLVTLKIEEVLSNTKDAETGQRGFIITRDSFFLQPSIGATERVAKGLTSLDSLVRDNETQTNNFKTYQSLVLSRLKHLKRLRDYIFSTVAHPDTLQTYFREGKTIMDGVREQAALMEKAEQNLLTQRIQQNQSNVLITPLVTLSLSLLLLFFVIVAFFVIRNRYRELEKTKTELNNINLQLKQRNEFIELLLDNSINLINVFDSDTRFLMFNECSAKATGKKKEEVIGKKLLEAFPQPETSLPYQNLLKALKGIPVHETGYFSERMKRYYDNYIIPIKDNNGKVYAALSIANDVTNLKQTENDLKASEEKFKGLIEHAPDAVVIVDREGCIQIVNMQTEKIFGYKREELIGSKVEILIPEQLKQAHTGHRTGFFADPKFREMGSGLELKGRRKDGSEFPVEISLSPLHIKEGILVTAAIRDITRRKQTEDELKQSNQELLRSNAQLESFNYIASHDLREPLRKIQVFTGKILESESKSISSKAKDYFKRIENSCSRMQDLVNSLFDYSMLGSDGLKFEQVDLNLVLEEIKKNLLEIIEEKKLTIYSDRLPTIFADRIQMHELFSNLIDNSIKYSKANPPAVITITVNELKNFRKNEKDSPKSFWKISFRDNGIGFDPAYNEKIFELFEMLHGKHDYPGTGVGLAICKKIVENHGGFITAEGSEEEGAAFHIFVPQLSVNVQRNS